MPLLVGFHPGYERRGIYSVEVVLEKLGNWSAVFDGDVIRLTSLRYRMFAQSRFCVGCGIEGLYFAKERTAKKLKDGTWQSFETAWHLNLYALDYKGTEVLMTKDHIHPRSKGGQNVLENLQTMCIRCNGKKGDRVIFQPGLPFESSITL